MRRTERRAKPPLHGRRLAGFNVKKRKKFLFDVAALLSTEGAGHQFEGAGAGAAGAAAGGAAGQAPPPLFHCGHRSASFTPLSAVSMCWPQPAQLGFLHDAHSLRGSRDKRVGR